MEQLARQERGPGASRPESGGTGAGWENAPAGRRPGPTSTWRSLAILAIFYFFLIRPQSQQRKKHEAALRALKRGDQIVTFGGIVGEVVHIKEIATGEGVTARPLEDQITIKSAESRLVVERGKIARILGGTSAPAATKE